MDEPVLRADFLKASRLISGRWPEPFPSILQGPPTTTGFIAFDTEFTIEGKRLKHWSWSDGQVVGVVYGPVVEIPQVVFHNGPADWPFLPVTPTEWEDTMYAHAALYAGFPHDLNYLGSFWARTNRWKHLADTNPEQYSAGDALGTWDAYTALRAQLEGDRGAAYIYRDTLRPLVPLLSRREPITLHRARIREAVQRMKSQMDGLKLEAQALAGWPINLGAPQQVERELKGK